MNAEQIYHTAASTVLEASESQMFGKPCYKKGGKAFCCFFQDEMVFKLAGETHAEALALSGSKLFDPSGKGRAMKAWVQVSVQHATKWASLATSAAAQL